MVTSAEIAAAVGESTITRRFVDTVGRRGERVALRWKSDAGWGEWTWTDYADRAARVAAGLAALGVGRGDRIVMLLRNRPEFHVVDMAALLLGATPISIYNSSSPSQIQYVASHCEAAVAVVEDAAFLHRVLDVRGALPALRSIVVVEPPADARAGVLRFDELLSAAPVDLEAASGIARPDDLITVIYTSGTTGPAKGVMLDHRNVVWTVESLLRAFGDLPVEGRRLVSYLPMAHIAERELSHYQGIVAGYEVTTCPEPNLVAQYLPAVRPELLFGVPRIWEKIHAGVLASVRKDPAALEAMEHALALGRRAALARFDGGTFAAGEQAELERLDAAVLQPIREMLGLDQVVSAISGAAPIPVEVLDFFLGLGVPISEIYGMSESSGPMTWTPFRIRPGTVGPEIPGCEVRLAQDGEVLCRGGNVFRGYLNDPEKTAEALDGDGWLHSGDIGVLDGHGYLEIVDRKKELIITAGGKNISPANLEGALKASPLIGQACVIGDGRPFISALLVLDADVAPAWARQHDIEASSLAALATHPDVLAEVERNVADANRRFSSVEQVKKFTVLAEEWMPDSEELTPTMKLKRRGVLAKHAAEIDAMYRL
ncbi:MAG: AMP-dependent synthetase/ligase [Acidimicrobiia bacterium]